MAGETGIDFNYGGAENLQLTAVIPLDYQADGQAGLGNIELAAKYRFLHQDDVGFDLSTFPAVILPSASSNVGADHASLFLPLWAQKDFGSWSLFGGGGCTLNKSGDDRNFCQGGIALTKEVFEGLTLGGEIFHQSADSLGEKSATSIGFGATYDLAENYHLLTYWGPGLENQTVSGRYDWYAAVLFTF